MSGGIVEIESSEFDRLQEAIETCPSVSESAINRVLHGKGGRLIGAAIDALVPVSGRTFKGHTSGAKGAAWQRYDIGENLAVTVGTKSKYHYLYFPDDGGNTMRHAGNKQFFAAGGDEAAPSVIDACIEEIISRIGG